MVKYLITNLLLVLCITQVTFAQVPIKKELIIQSNDFNSPKVKFAFERLKNTLENTGYTIIQKVNTSIPEFQINILEASEKGALLLEKTPKTVNLKSEGFSIYSNNNSSDVLIIGADESGLLYGCLALIDEIKDKNKLPANLDVRDEPEMVLRGTAIGVQKTYYLPERTVYEYPYTEEEFPWFYDKKMWLSYLDMMVENRYNSLYLWNGHPFASLVRLKDYPYALEVDDETFKKNEEMFQFLTAEAEKRGIWVIQMFYNIIVSKPFAEHHGIKTQDRNRPITPLIADYTKQSIKAFVEKYPNVGLLVTLGEAMEGVGQDDIDWFTKTIIPAVKEGLKATGKTVEPPIVLRAHDTDAPAVMKASKPLYDNLYTMAKYNGEALTTYTPRGSWAELHRTLSAAAPVHIQNVHILANLEPFRYGSADFIQKSVRAMHDVYGSNGLHLYPQASYWDWPYAADKISDNESTRLLQLDRDWIWYQAWARYAWNSKRDRSEEIKYWADELASFYNSDQKTGEAILEAYEETGEIAPKLLRRFGITDGNRQTLTLGMFMTQFINPFKYNLFTMLYESEAPEGEMIIEEAKKNWMGEEHIGELPSQVAQEVLVHGAKAVEAIERAKSNIKSNTEEFERLSNDIYIYDALAKFYSSKVRSALQVLRYKYSYDIEDLEKAKPLLAESVAHFKELVSLTENTYYYANSMQTPSRKIPIRATDGKFKTWTELLPLYEKEYDHFTRSIDSLKLASNEGKAASVKPLKSVKVRLNKNYSTYPISKGQRVFSDDKEALIVDMAGELKGLQGIMVNRAQQISDGTTLTFTTKKPVKLLVGYFMEDKVGYVSDERESLYAPVPTLEIDATANNYGQSDIIITNAIEIVGHPRVNIHSYSFDKGKHTLTLPKGLCLPIGFISENETIRPYNAGMGVADEDREIDWLFE